MMGKMKWLIIILLLMGNTIAQSDSTSVNITLSGPDVSTTTSVTTTLPSEDDHGASSGGGLMGLLAKVIPSVTTTLPLPPTATPAEVEAARASFQEIQEKSRQSILLFIVLSSASTMVYVYGMHTILVFGVKKTRWSILYANLKKRWLLWKREKKTNAMMRGGRRV